MSRVTISLRMLVLTAALACGAYAPTARAEDPAPAPAPAGGTQLAPAGDAADNAPGDAREPLSPREKARRDAMRKVALVSLALILVLICFTVLVMIVTRRLRIRYLHHDRKVTFSRLWDVWWHPRGDAPDDAKKKPKS